MAIMKTEVFADQDLTVVTSKGELSCQEIIACTVEYYKDTSTRFLIFDNSKADMSKLSSEDFRKIAKEAKKNGGNRIGAKTAIVFEQDENFGLARMYEALAEIEGVQYDINVFRNIEDAKKWMGL